MFKIEVYLTDVHLTVGCGTPEALHSTTKISPSCAILSVGSTIHSGGAF